jgi:hypothetical protein
VTTTHKVTQERGPHVLDGLVQWFSPTVLTAAAEEQDGGCQRKHWFTYVDPSRSETPPTKKQSLGIITHDMIEKVLKGEEGIASALALAMLREADAHRGALAAGIVEAPVGELSSGARMACAGVPFYGHTDVVIPKPGREVEILDWKTTSSIAKWAKTGPELLQTIQMPAYGEWAARRYAATRVRLTHVYGDTKTGSASRRSILASRDEIAHRWEYVETVGRRIIEHAAYESPDDVPANKAACGAYGGCPFRGRCSVGRKTMLEGAMGLMSKMKKPASGAEPTSAPTAETPGSPPEGDVQAQLAALEAEAEKARAALAAQGKTEGVPETGVVPPDAPPSEHPLPEPEKKGKGRPKGSKNKPKTEAPDPLPGQEKLPLEKPEGLSAGVALRDADRKLAGLPSAGEGFLLEVYVDCIITAPTESLHTVLAKICRDLCDEHGCLDVRCAPSDSHLAFGRWKGYVAQRVEEWAKTASGSYTLDTRGSEIAEVAADVLRTAAPLFVRGIR